MSYRSVRPAALLTSPNMQCKHLCSSLVVPSLPLYLLVGSSEAGQPEGLRYLTVCFACIAMLILLIVGSGAVSKGEQFMNVYQYMKSESLTLPPGSLDLWKSVVSRMRAEVGSVSWFC
jgi:hypothetical protein